MAAKKTPTKPKLIFEVTRGAVIPDKKFYWIAFTANRTCVAQCAKGYGRRRDCLSSIDTLVKHIKAKSYTIVEK
jgi:hypothetical protein